MRKSRTITINDVVLFGNTHLATSDPDRTEFRLGICSVLESILMATRSYEGFEYTDGTKEGTIDHTRRKYF